MPKMKSQYLILLLLPLFFSCKSHNQKLAEMGVGGIEKCFHLTGSLPEVPSYMYPYPQAQQKQWNMLRIDSPIFYSKLGDSVFAVWYLNQPKILSLYETRIGMRGEWRLDTVDILNDLKHGIACYESDSLLQAIFLLSKVISVNDTCADCYLYRSFAFKDLKEYHWALEDINNLILLDTTQAVGYANRASIYYLEHNYSWALADDQRAYRLSSSKIMYNPISHMLFATGQKDSACKYYQLAIENGDTTFDVSIKRYCDSIHNASHLEQYPSTN